MAIDWSKLAGIDWAEVQAKQLAAGGPGPALAEMGESGDPVNRIQFAVDLANQLGLDTSDTSVASDRFTDVGSLTPTQLGAISALVTAGIIQGTSATTFSPGSAVTREHASLMLDRAGMDSSSIIRDTSRPGDPLLVSELGHVNDRIPDAMAAAGLIPQEEALAAEIDPLSDSRYATFLANTGMSKSEIDNSLVLSKAASQQRIDLANAMMEAQLQTYGASKETGYAQTEASRDTTYQQTAANLARAQEEMASTIARAQGNRDTRLAADAALYDDRRDTTQRGIFQDYESRGFFRSGARPLARDQAFKTIGLTQDASENALEQAFLNTRTAEQNQFADAQTAYGNTRLGADTAFSNARLGLDTNYDNQALMARTGYDATAAVEGTTQIRDADLAVREKGALDRQTYLEELDARERMTRMALDQAGGRR